MEWYRPGAIVLQCGADSLAGDKLGMFNLSMKGELLIGYNIAHYAYNHTLRAQAMLTASSSSRASMFPSFLSEVEGTQSR